VLRASGEQDSCGPRGDTPQNVRMHRCLFSTTALLLLGALAAAPFVFADEDESTGEAEVEFSLDALELAPVLASQRTDLRWFHPIDGALVIGIHSIPIKATKDGLLVASAPGKVPSQRVKDGETVHVTLGSGDVRRKIAVAVRPGQGEHAGTWFAAVVEARRLSVGVASVVLVDLDGDGRITTAGADGYRARGSPLTLPLTDHLIVGADRLTITRVEDTLLFATVERLADTPDQRIALAKINKMRTRDGLPPVTLDEKLSAACTAHAAYLRANHWSGYTNPHGEEEGKPGYSAEGNVAARASVIMGAPHRSAIDAYFRTHYHRAGFTDPYLERVGISTGGGWISVIDVNSGSEPPEQGDPVWKDPILVPADGSIDFETAFCGLGEVPAPTTKPSARGNPLTILFRRWDHGVIDFEGELVRIEGDKEIPVPTIVAEEQQGSRLLGLVPERPLRADSTYRVRYRFGRHEEPEQLATATFRTR
jgi:hypothetical protein